MIYRSHHAPQGVNTVSRKIENRVGLFGTVSHYENGRKIGESRPSLFGGSKFYDNRGRKVGESHVGFFSNSLYDSRGRKIGETTPTLLGSVTRLKDKR